MVDQDSFRRTIMFADCLYRGDRYSIAAQVTRSDIPVRRSALLRANAVPYQATS
jgi:hypothetical protein